MIAVTLMVHVGHRAGWRAVSSLYQMLRAVRANLP